MQRRDTRGTRNRLRDGWELARVASISWSLGPGSRSVALVLVLLASARARAADQPPVLRFVQTAAPALNFPQQFADPGPAILPKEPPQPAPATPAPQGALGETIPAPKPGVLIPIRPSVAPDAFRIDAQGEKISLSVQNLPLGQVVTMLAEKKGLNVVFAEAATNPITTSLQNVTLQDALTAILSVSGYRWTEHNGIIFVSKLSEATNLPAYVQGRQIQVFPLDYKSAKDMSEAVQGLLSPSGKAYIAESSPTDNRKTKDAIVIEDVPDVVARAAEFIERIDQPPRQVLIEAHVLQVDLTDDRKHGVDFDQLIKSRQGTITLGATGFANPSASPATFIEIDADNLTALLQCLETVNEAKTLASPKVLVLDGQEARFQVGSQLGYRVTTSTETSSLESVEFLEVGIVLTVTPRIGRDNQVMMRVKPEVSNGRVSADTGLPEKGTTELETDVLLASGCGIVIGGLIQEKDAESISKLPYLGSLKFVGPLFQRRVMLKQRSEIVVTLMPHILPYDSQRQMYEDVELSRTQTPLFNPPLERNPRPWEPSLIESQQEQSLPLFRRKGACRLAHQHGVGKCESPPESADALDSPEADPPEIEEPSRPAAAKPLATGGQPPRVATASGPRTGSPKAAAVRPASAEFQLPAPVSRPQTLNKSTIRLR